MTPVHLLPLFARIPMSKSTLHQIEEAVCIVYSVTSDELHQRWGRPLRITFPRQVAIYLMHELTGRPLTTIALHFDLSASGALYSVKVVRDAIATYPDVKLAIDKVTEALKQLLSDETRSE